jgi:hypothetical protein
VKQLPSAKGHEFSLPQGGWPIQAVLWLEWGRESLGAGSWIRVNSDNGTISGIGYDSNGDPEYSIAGATGSTDSNNWGAWTQTFNAGSLANQSGNNSWGLNFAKSFFGGFSLKSIYQSFVEEDGCDRMMAETLLRDVSPFPTEPNAANANPGPTDATEPATKFLSAVAYNRALGYAATRGLSYPMKSPVFRGLLDLSENIEASAPELTGLLASGDALQNGVRSAIDGVCH